MAKKSYKVINLTVSGFEIDPFPSHLVIRPFQKFLDSQKVRNLPN